MSEPKPGCPTFPSAFGAVAVDYSNYDGVVVLGAQPWEFHTNWSESGDGSIYFYDDARGTKAIAVARGIGLIEQIDDQAYSDLNFTSRTRTIREGEIGVIENQQGYAAAIHVTRVLADREVGDTAWLEFRYAILTDGSKDFSSLGLVTPRDDRAYMAAIAAQKAKRTLNKARSVFSSENPIDRLGHNNPPDSLELTEEDFQDIKVALDKVQLIASAPDLDTVALSAQNEQLESALEKVRAFIEDKLNVVADAIVGWGVTAIMAALASDIAQTIEAIGYLLVQYSGLS